jgi:hypothetical protein
MDGETNHDLGAQLGRVRRLPEASLLLPVHSTDETCSESKEEEMGSHFRLEFLRNKWM